MKTTRFILIDDDPHNNNLCKLYIRHTLPMVEVIDFTLPEKGFHYVETAFNNSEVIYAILLLDINMPLMTGWDFLEKYDGLDKKIKDQITIYILSSSVDLRDKDKALNNKYVKGYLVKPLEIDEIRKIYETNVNLIT
jgi:response regulator RpfG family c-di-GMP phosphodiesterase